MSRRSAIVALALVACGERGDPPAAVGPTPEVVIDAGVAAPAITAPHGGEIALVAVADGAQAAVTADDHGALRFWPTLDGTREPVAIPAPPANELALVHTRDGSTAALLDAAAGIELVHVGPDGGVRGRQVLPAEPGYEELAASATALLARRRDHVIARLDAGRIRTLAPAPGEQVLAIAARGGAAVAGIADPDRTSEIHVVRELSVTGELAWGRSHALPVPLAAPIAVSPSGRRIAGLHARNRSAVVIELVPRPRVVASQVDDGDFAAPALGFLDDTRAVFRGGGVLPTPTATSTADPWSGTRPEVRVRLGRGAVVADGAVVSGLGTHLVIASPERTRFLGYRDVGAGSLRVTGAQVTLGYGARVLWLDDALGVVRARDVVPDAGGGVAVDTQHLLIASIEYVADRRSRLDVALLDAVADRLRPLGSWPHGENVTYDPDTRVLAISGSTTRVARTRLDVATATVTPLRPLLTRRHPTIALLDPARADGVVAVAYTFGDVGLHIDTFVDDDPAATRPLAARSSVAVADVMSPIGTDRNGTMYTLGTSRAGRPHPLYGHKAGKQVRRLSVDADAAGAAVDPAGTMIAVYSPTQVILYAMDGTERWRVPAWSVNIARFTADGRTLLVNTQGGLVSLDPATGARRAAGCGWGFGLSPDEPSLAVFPAPVVCAEAP